MASEMHYRGLPKHQP